MDIKTHLTDSKHAKADMCQLETAASQSNNTSILHIVPAISMTFQEDEAGNLLQFFPILILKAQ